MKGVGGRANKLFRDGGIVLLALCAGGLNRREWEWFVDVFICGVVAGEFGAEVWCLFLRHLKATV